MAKLYAARGAQYVLSSEFIFNFNDTITDINGVVKDFGTTIASAPVADIIKLPPGAQVVGGDIVIETAGVGPTAYTIDLGVAGATTCFASAFDLKGAVNARTALLLTGLNNTYTGKDIRLTMVDSVAAATAGRFRITVLWKLDGKVNEVYPV